MIDDSIPSSPSKSNKSIRDTRLKRKNKRNKVVQSVDLNSDREQNDINLYNLINEFYKDSEDEATEIDTKAKNSTFLVEKHSAIIRNFKPFELEKSFAMADRILPQQIKQNKPNILPETQGFITCISLNEANLNTKDCKTTSEERNSSFIITESELINCCHQAERILENTPVEQYNLELKEHEITPEKDDNMVLVNSILNDFSQSPLGKGQIIQNSSWQYTPEFRLHRQPVKNYSRKFLNSSKTNLNQRFEEQVKRESSENGDDHSSYSSLSLQEDVTLGESFNNQSVVTNTGNTQHLCKNLLNLSEYYTQNQSPQSLSDEQEMQDTNDSCLLTNSQENVSVLYNVTDLLNDILTLRSIYPPSIIRFDSFDSLDNFHGFDFMECVMDDENNEQTITNKNLNTVHDLKDCDIRQPNTQTNQKDNTRLDDWNEDDCHDIFACINTENVLLQHNIHMYKTPNKTEYFREPEISVESDAPSNWGGFKTASSKSIKVSREAHLMAAKILSKLPEIPDFVENDHPNNCGKITTNEDNYRLDDWNEDDFHDIFACINTENVLQQHNINTKHNEMVNVIEHSMHKSPNKTEYFREPEISVENAAPSNCTGFKTASSKPIKVSRETHLVAAKILSKLPEIPEFEENSAPNNCDKKTTNEDENLFENPEDYEWNDNCDLFLNFKTPIGLKATTDAMFDKQPHLIDRPLEQDGPSTSKSAMMGFKTAGGKNVQISSKAQKTVQELLKEFACAVENDNNYEEELREIKCKVYAKTHNLQAEQSSLSDIKDLNADRGLQVAKGKNITISMTDQQTAKNFISQFCRESEKSHKEDLDILKQIDNDIELQKLAPELKTKSNENTDSTKAAQEEVAPLKSQIISNDQFEVNVGLQTAKGKHIATSYKAQKGVQKLLEEFNKIPKEDYLNDLISIKLDVNKRNDKHKAECKYKSTYGNSLISENNVDLFEINTNEENQLLQVPEQRVNPFNGNIGFQTANGKNVFISDKAKQAVEKLFQEFETISNISNYEHDLKELKTNIQTKNKDLATKFVQEHNEYDNMVSSEYPLSPKECNEPNAEAGTINSKRKNSIDNSDLESHIRTPPGKIFKNGLHTSKSSFAEQTLKSPLTSASHSLILRKNLLSLTKKRKNKRCSLNEETNDLNVNTVTPIKSSISLKAADQTPATPNLKEFFANAPLTSTPQINKASKSLHTIDDTDLKPITWNNTNDDSINDKSSNKSPVRTTKLSESSSLNITLNSSNPTVKERIDRLKMYGKAPPVSPILIETNHNCRPSGLRRTRSMMKKNEE